MLALVSEYLKKTTILLVSSQTSLRSGLRKLLCDLGADNRAVEIASDFDQALTRLKSRDPVNFIITDDEIGGNHTGLELIPLHENNNPISRKRIFIMLSGEINPFILSNFTVKGGDLLLKKPYTNQAFTASIQELIAKKENFSPDERNAQDVLDALKIRDLNMAMDSYNRFADKNTHPALYCRGQIYQLDHDYGRAFDSYAEALEKKIELRSLVSAIETGALAKKYADMIPMVEAWIKSFPLHQDSVLDITKAIVFNRKFNLLREMSKKLSGVRVAPVAGLPMGAGFVIAAMENQKSRPERAVFYALRGIEYSGGKPSILTNAFRVLMASGGRSEAENIFKEMFSSPPFAEDKNLENEIKKIVHPHS